MRVTFSFDCICFCIVQSYFISLYFILLRTYTTFKIWFFLFGTNVCDIIGKNGHDVRTMNLWQTLLVPCPYPLSTYHPCPARAGSSLPQVPVALPEALPEAVSGSPLRGKGLMCRGVGAVSWWWGLESKYPSCHPMDGATLRYALQHPQGSPARVSPSRPQWWPAH